MKVPTRTLARFALLALAAGSLASLGGCNTVEGAGEDVVAAGDGISNAAQETGQAIDRAFDGDN